MATKTAEPQLLRLAEFRGEIKFAEGVKEVSEVQIMREGLFLHPYYGPMRITQQVLSEFVANFKANVRRQDLPIDYFHESDREAAGWFLDVYLSGDGKELWGKAKWTPRAQQMLADGELKYFSADFYFEWTDPETGVAYKNVLNGGGLVNRPFIKDMKPVVELSEGNEQMKTVEQLQGEIKTLGEQIVAKDAALADASKLSEQVKTLGETVKAKDAEILELKGKAAVAAKKAEDDAKVAKFDELCRTGKACAAQKDAYLAGDMVKFAELAQPLNVVEKGGAEGDKTNGKLSEEEKAMCKKLNLTEEEYIKYNS